MTSLSFPDGFKWGTATAAYQIEGATGEDGRGESIWDRFSKTPGKVANGDNGDIACDSYHKLVEDADLLASLGAKYHRFSIAWPRILPNGTGAVNQAGLDHYRQKITLLKERGITPVVTLYHWDLPQALQDKGGWVNRDIIQWFNDYAKIVIGELGDIVNDWIILNEPSVVSFMGHLQGTHAPGLNDIHSFIHAVHHQNMVVGTVYRALKAINPAFNVGSSYNLTQARSLNSNWLEQTAAMIADGGAIGIFLDPLIKGQYPWFVRPMFEMIQRPGDLAICQTKLDFLGVQHYSPTYVKLDIRKPFAFDIADPPPQYQRTSMGWAIDPLAFAEILLRIKNDYGNPPVIVTECGAAFAEKPDATGKVHDTQRRDYLRDYLAAMHGAIGQGANIKGLFVWSLLDNFEWAEGYDKTFGLVHVDYQNNAKRTPKASFEWFRHVVAENGFNLPHPAVNPKPNYPAPPMP